MKKNRMMRLAAVLLVLVLLTTSVISGTFAKYTSTVSGADTATVAKWSFTQKKADNDTAELIVANKTETITFDLFATINDSTDGNDETEVANDKIAPGTMGSFKLEIQNTSEVDAVYTLVLTEKQENNNTTVIPIQYSYDGYTWKDNIADLKLENQAIDMTTSLEKTVFWRWAFDVTDTTHHTSQSDVNDTTLGILAQSTAPTVTITATITFTQVD